MQTGNREFLPANSKVEGTWPQFYGGPERPNALQLNKTPKCCTNTHKNWRSETITWWNSCGSRRKQNMQRIEPHFYRGGLVSVVRGKKNRRSVSLRLYSLEITSLLWLSLQNGGQLNVNWLVVTCHVCKTSMFCANYPRHKAFPYLCLHVTIPMHQKFHFPGELP